MVGTGTIGVEWVSAGHWTDRFTFITLFSFYYDPVGTYYHHAAIGWITWVFSVFSLVSSCFELFPYDGCSGCLHFPSTLQITMHCSNSSQLQVTV